MMKKREKWEDNITKYNKNRKYSSGRGYSNEHKKNQKCTFSNGTLRKF